MAQAMDPDIRQSPPPKESARQDFLLLFLVNLGVVALAYYPLVAPHFATDSYSAFFDLSPATPANLGRLLTALIAAFFQRLGFYPIVYQSAFTVLMFVVVALCCTLVLQQFRRELALMRQAGGLSALAEIALAAGVLIAFVNVALQEWFLFPEVTLYFALALSLSTLAFKAWATRRGWWAVAAACLLLYGALNVYQASLGFFVIPALALVIVRHQSAPVWAAWREGIGALAIGAGCAIANLAVTQMSIRMGWLQREIRNPGFTSENLRKSVAPVLDGIAEMWDGFYTLMPPDVIGGMAIALLVVLLLGAATRQYGWSRLILPVVALAIGLGVVFAPHLVTAIVWITPRSIAPVFALYTLLIVCVLLLCRDRYSTAFVAGLAVVFIGISVWQIHAISASHLVHNQLEQREARTIVDEIEDYERKSGTQVQSIGIVFDNETTWIYPPESGVEHAFHDLNVRSMTRPWSDLAILHFVSGRHFSRALVSDEKRAELLAEEPNWTEFDADDQVSFDGSTAYIIVY